MRRLRAVNGVLVRLETYAAGGLLVTVAVVVLLQVLMRYLFAYPNPWSEEVSRFCFIWLSLLGASLAVEHRAHFGFDQVTKALAPPGKRAVEMFAEGVVLLFSVLLIATGIALMDLTMGERSPALGLPVALVYAAAPVSGMLMVVHMVAGWMGGGAGMSRSDVALQPASISGSEGPRGAGAEGRPAERTLGDAHRSTEDVS